MIDDDGRLRAIVPDFGEHCTSRGSACEWPVSRREFVIGAGAVAGVSAFSRTVVADEPAPTAGKHVLSLTINGERKQLEIDPRTSLLDLLREDLHLTGTKKGCDHGQCGACTILAGGRRINSCLALAISYDGEELITIEGLAHGGSLDPMQQAFLDHDGYQCGYCTPGQVISAVALLDEVDKCRGSAVTADLRQPGPIDLTDDEIRERMSGNICRCGAYPGIVAAVRQAFGYKKGGAPVDSNQRGNRHEAI